MNLLQKLYNVFDTFIPEGTSLKAAMREMSRKGRFSDTKMLAEGLFLLAEEIEEIKAHIKPPKK